VGHGRLVQIADLAGPYGIGMLLAATNAVLAGVFSAGLRGARHTLSCVGMAAALAAVLVYGHWRLGQSFAAGEARRIAAVQGAIERGFRWRPEYRRMGLERYVELTRTAAAERPDLVLWPEYAVSFYPQEASPEQRILLETAAGLGADLLLGAPHYGFATGGTIYHNSVFLVRQGTIAGRYDKMEPLLLAERPLLGGALGASGTPYTSGRYLGLFAVAGMRLGVFICVESAYPELVRRIARAGAEVLAEFSNDAWFTYEAPARLRLDMASLRAVENRRHLIRAASTGISAVIDPHGRVREATSLGKPAVLVDVVRPSTAITPYQRFGDSFAWLAVGAVGVHGFAYRGRRRRPDTPSDRCEAAVHAA
jgi:apolipoprotein N-acyltransferase